MSELVRVEGVAEFTKAVDRIQYGEADKVVKLAMTDAAKVAVKEIKPLMPKKMFAQLAKYKFKQGAKLKFMNIGLFDKHKTLPQLGYPNTRGNNKSVWSIAYWLNYGTLNRRDRTHKFREAIKRKSVNSKRGVRPQKFYDTAEDRITSAYADAFNKALDARVNKFFNGK